MPFLENIFRKTNAKFEIMAPIKPDNDSKQPHEGASENDLYFHSNPSLFNKIIKQPKANHVTL